MYSIWKIILTVALITEHWSRAVDRVRPASPSQPRERPEQDEYG